MFTVRRHESESYVSNLNGKEYDHNERKKRGSGKRRIAKSKR